MYINGNTRHVENIPGSRHVIIKENDELSEFQHDISQELL
jgi:hypothetical protein